MILSARRSGKRAEMKARFMELLGKTLEDVELGKKEIEYMSIVFHDFTVDVEVSRRENCRGGHCGLVDDVGVTCKRHTPKHFSSDAVIREEK